MNRHDKFQLGFAIVVIVLLTLVLTSPAYSYELYPGEPRTNGFEFQAHVDCSNYMYNAATREAEKYSRFVHLSVNGRTSASKGYDGTNAFFCVDSISSPPANALTTPCFFNGHLYECTEFVIEEESQLVVGRATWWRWTPQSTEILECDVEVVTDTENLPNVIAHEMAGHCLGLTHNSIIGSLMYPSIYSWTYLQMDDIAGLCHLYLCKEPVPDAAGFCIWIPRISLIGQDEVWQGAVCNFKTFYVSEVLP